VPGGADKEIPIPLIVENLKLEQTGEDLNLPFKGWQILYRFV
jgi:hypothetical protein